MKFEVIEKEWYKRRNGLTDYDMLNNPEFIPDPTPRAINVEIPEYVQQHNHMCKMFVTYDNGEEATYIARVIYNKLNCTWTVDGMQVAVKVMPE